MTKYFLNNLLAARMILPWNVNCENFLDNNSEIFLLEQRLVNGVTDNRVNLCRVEQVDKRVEVINA